MEKLFSKAVTSGKLNAGSERNATSSVIGIKTEKRGNGEKKLQPSKNDPAKVEKICEELYSQLVISYLLQTPKMLYFTDEDLRIFCSAPNYEPWRTGLCRCIVLPKHILCNYGICLNFPLVYH